MVRCFNMMSPYPLPCRCADAQQARWEGVDGSSFHSCYSLATVSAENLYLYKEGLLLNVGMSIISKVLVEHFYILINFGLVLWQYHQAHRVLSN